MAKTIQKHFFTEDLSKYKHFLRASDVNIAASIATMQQEIDVHQKIIALIERYQTEKTADKKDLTELAAVSCPDFVTLNAFEKMNSNAYSSIDDLFNVPAEEIVLDCSKTTCELCWKNYINQIARLLNQSFIDVKLYDPTEDDHGNQDPET